MKEQIVRIMDIHNILSNNKEMYDQDKLFSAYIFAATKHRGQLRKSGAPYLSHPLSVSKILADMNMDLDTVIAGLLHDTLEDTDTTYEELEKRFGKDVAFLVDGVSKISKIRFMSNEEKQAENFRKMLVSVSKDVRVILIKLADRLHNMRTIEYLPPEKAKRISKETLEIYAPLAHRLGIAWIKWELEDLCFRTLQPDKYYEIYNKVKLKRSEREKYLQKVKKIVEKELQKNNITDFELSGRPKHFYSIYHKMITKKASFDDIYDLIAIRILVNKVSECYAVLGIIHNLWKPIPGRFKDFIAMPKANMYQSLHTTVIGPDGLRVEFQIRTYFMHSIAEEGIAAHWIYKEGKNKLTEDDKAFIWLRQLLNQKELKNPTDLIEALKEDILPTQIYVFTPKGDIIELPVGSTPIDFAYAIHTEIGHRCTGAKVNGRIMSIKYRLKNGEKVEILTSNRGEPKRDWLNFTKTSRAKIRIRSYLRKKEQDKAIAYGGYLLEKEFENHSIDFKDILNDKEKTNLILKKFSLNNIDDLYTSLGFKRISPKQVLHLFVKEDSPVKVQTLEPKKRKTGPFIIDNIDNMLVQIARCCNPVFGDKIKGYITNTRGIVIHKENCKNLKLPTVNSDKLIDVKWDESVKFKTSVTISIVGEDRKGLLNDVTAVLKDLNINILELSAKNINFNIATQKIKIEVNDRNELNYVLTKLQELKGIHKVRLD
ncbi:MAG: bifunctional (p)ppGpp synthetase/guanosine-3',5'-bis(diphosphate) 3'-pyrophosphohydrolase [Deferribacterota bacterium]|nr:bifunctional (p)ppGpp synthetase/guanosine-3',5'-bis(diphosphate) 3'-pyrophosphohydrolase [Deferribacterota bacterium]